MSELYKDDKWTVRANSTLIASVTYKYMGYNFETYGFLTDWELDREYFWYLVRKTMCEAICEKRKEIEK